MGGVVVVGGGSMCPEAINSYCTQIHFSLSGCREAKCWAMSASPALEDVYKQTEMVMKVGGHERVNHAVTFRD